MINITEVSCKDEGDIAQVDIHFELDSENITIHAIGFFVDIIDSQGYCDDWTFLAKDTLCDIEYSRFEDYTFDVQVAYGILTRLYPSEHILMKSH